ncbi:hypothetical protein BY458DRAFT_191770 [Sporodiniella umbellata]|nr:hypothetical protein BY458DRAFT_191770 [Sporodiniella umbellata]
MNLSYKRRQFHVNLHIQEDNAVKELITSTTVKPNDKIDRLFLGTDDMFNPQGIKEKMLNWLATVHHIVKIHKQDLLYYNILDFTARTGSAGVYTIFKDKYSLAKHHYQSYQNDIDSEAKDNCADVKNYATSIFKHKSLRKSLKRAKMQRRRSQTKPKYEKYCLRVLSTYNNLSTKRSLFEDNINENEFTMCFMYPLFYNLLKYSKRNIVIRWGEAELISKKKEEHHALDDDDRRSPGPNVDFTFRSMIYNNVEFAVGEVSGAPLMQNQTHFVDDRKKIAKNLKTMIKSIINLKKHIIESHVQNIQIYGIQIYELKVIVYRMMYVQGLYVFMEADNFSIPNLPATYKDQLPDFISNMWKLKNLILESHQSIANYLSLSSTSDGTETPLSNLSSPYVSPTKRQKR